MAVMSLPLHWKTAAVGVHVSLRAWVQGTREGPHEYASLRHAQSNAGSTPLGREEEIRANSSAVVGGGRDEAVVRTGNGNVMMKSLESVDCQYR